MLVSSFSEVEARGILEGNREVPFPIVETKSGVMKTLATVLVPLRFYPRTGLSLSTDIHIFTALPTT